MKITDVCALMGMSLRRFFFLCQWKRHFCPPALTAACAQTLQRKPLLQSQTTIQSFSLLKVFIVLILEIEVKKLKDSELSEMAQGKALAA